jgi:citrate synthase
MLEDQEQKIARPRQIYTGYAERNFVPIEQRTEKKLAAGR